MLQYIVQYYICKTDPVYETLQIFQNGTKWRNPSHESKTLHQKDWDRRAKWGTTRSEADDYGRKVNQIAERDLIPATDIKLVRVSSQNLANDRRAVYAIDGNPRTVWHSQFSKKLARHSHELVIDLGATYEIRGFCYLARQDSSWNGAFAKTEFYVSNSPDTFGKPAAKATSRRCAYPRRRIVRNQFAAASCLFAYSLKSTRIPGPPHLRSASSDRSDFIHSQG